MIFDNQTCVIVSDPDGDTITLTFSNVPNGLTVSDNGGGEVLLNGTPDGTSPWTFNVLAADGNGGSASETITLTCGAGSSTLVGGSLPDKDITFGSMGACDASGCFAGAQGALNYSVVSAPSITGLTVDASGMIMIPDTAAIGAYVITVTANDGVSSANCTLNLDVESDAGAGPVNGPDCPAFPTVEGNMPTSQTVGPYQAFTGGVAPISLSATGLIAGVTLINLGGGSYSLQIPANTNPNLPIEYSVTATDANGSIQACNGNFLEITGL